jgi:hypothetical protein
MEDIMSPSKSGSSQREAVARHDAAPSLPHDDDREGRQPYAKEIEDYKHGVATPPDERVKQENHETHRETREERAKR